SHARARLRRGLIQLLRTKLKPANGVPSRVFCFCPPHTPSRSNERMTDGAAETDRDLLRTPAVVPSPFLRARFSRNTVPPRRCRPASIHAGRSARQRFASGVAFQSHVAVGVEAWPAVGDLLHTRLPRAPRARERGGLQRRGIV